MTSLLPKMNNLSTQNHFHSIKIHRDYYTTYAVGLVFSPCCYCIELHFENILPLTDRQTNRQRDYPCIKFHDVCIPLLIQQVKKHVELSVPFWVYNFLIFLNCTFPNLFLICSVSLQTLHQNSRSRIELLVETK